MLIILVAIVSMAVADVFDAMQTIAEARGRAVAAGALCAVNNALTLGVGIVGADALITKGWEQAVILGLAVLVTTFLSTTLATRWASKRT